MSAPRAPWWMYVMAASFLVYFGLIIYCGFLGPEDLGVQPDFNRGLVILRAVLPNSPAARAGLQPGDIVVAAEGQAIHNRMDWMAVGANMEVGRYRLQIERGGVRLEAVVRLQRPSSDAKRLTVALIASGARLITLILALVIGFRRPKDPVALVGALFLATVAIAAYGLPHGLASTWRHVPVPLAGLLWIPFISQPAVGALLFTFFAVVPRPLFRARWAWVLIWTPQLIFLPLSISYAILRHRLFDVRVIIRQGLQYALARRVLLSLVPARSHASGSDFGLGTLHRYARPSGFWICDFGFWIEARGFRPATDFRFWILDFGFATLQPL